MMLAILLSNSNADELSQTRRKKLYKASVGYSKALHEMLQSKSPNWDSSRARKNLPP
jgi:hypothetical protein